MGKPSKPRNNIIELGRFIYSLLVVGYHVQFSYNNDDIDVFENGALAVEYYFLLSGYFLARSLEKISADQKTSLIRKVYEFMKNKIKALLNVHIVSIIAVLIIIACCDTKNFVDKFLNGLPNIFLVQMIIIWTEEIQPLIVPEWYLSSMLICMLIMVPIFLLFTKIIRGIFATIILLGILAVIAVVFGFASKWTFNQNITFDLRAWAEMDIGMFSYYLSVYVSKKNYGNGMNIFFKILEIIGYVAPIILGIIPISSNYQPYCMAVTIICVFCAIFITFANKGTFIKNEKVNSVFGYLGSISLPIYIYFILL